MVGRLPIGMTGLAILLLVQGESGSFVQAGAATAAYVAGLACVAPALGRLIDRRGPRATLAVCAILFPVMLLALVASVSSGVPWWFVLLLTGAAGAAFPPISVCMRTYFRQRFGDEPLLAAAYSLESILIEFIFIVGPMLVAAFVALASPALAVCFAAACGGLGAILFLYSPALRLWRVSPRGRPSLLGPLAEPGFAPLVAVIVGYSTAFGLLEIGITGYAAERGNQALAGVLLGLMSVGSVLGGLVYGSRSWHMPLSAQFAVTLALMGAGLSVLAVPWMPWAFALWSLVAGVVMAPALIIQAMLIAKTARAEHATEAFTWSSSALLGGVGLGLALGGALLEAWSSATAFLAAALAALSAAMGAGLWLARG